MYRSKKSYSPRLKSNESRKDKHLRFPPDVTKILKILAREDRCSVNWIVEQMVTMQLDLHIDYKVKVIKRK